MLYSQPYLWSTRHNPSALPPQHRSTEDNFVLRPAARRRSRRTQLSSSTRSRLRNKEHKLEKLKDYRYLRAKSADEVDRLLSSFFAQKAEKLTALASTMPLRSPASKSSSGPPATRGCEAGEPIIELHALECDGDMLALFSGVHDNQRFTSMFNSHTGCDNARHTGTDTVAAPGCRCADRGFSTFDIGPGEARYKTLFCKELEPIFDSALALSARAHAAAIPLRLTFKMKSAVKHNAALWAVASFVRRILNGLKG